MHTHALLHPPTDQEGSVDDDDFDDYVSVSISKDPFLHSSSPLSMQRWRGVFIIIIIIIICFFFFFCEVCVGVGDVHNYRLREVPGGFKLTHEIVSCQSRFPPCHTVEGQGCFRQIGLWVPEADGSVYVRLIILQYKSHIQKERLSSGVMHLIPVAYHHKK